MEGKKTSQRKSSGGRKGLPQGGKSENKRTKPDVSERPSMGKATVPPALQDPEQRANWNLPESTTEPGPYMVELNLLYKGGLEEATVKFKEFYSRVISDKTRPPVPISKTYYRCNISVEEWSRLVKEDERNIDRKERLIYRIWPDFPVKALIDRSIVTVKADAALRAFEASGASIVWAVIDSGIDRTHPHFEIHNTLEDDDVMELHRDFTGDGEPDKQTAKAALTDNFGHGTHVAGIIAGEIAAGTEVAAYERVFESDPASFKKTSEKLERRTLGKNSRFKGVAPLCKLVSLKVLDDEGRGRASNIMLALQYVREKLNDDPKLLRVHGVNLSVGYEFDPELFACGQSPLCVEVDRLVKSGVVTVVAAGNTGCGNVDSLQRKTKVGISNTINDPGNSALAITVGATHREFPHMYGVSYFSSKGPTGDGRLKPDLVAPGERITSCAAGKKIQKNGGEIPDQPPAYVDDTGTSMAAPHVSGAIAAFLSIRREFIQRPEEVKRIFLQSATPLGRERYFEGNGLLDLMRAIQSV